MKVGQLRRQMLMLKFFVMILFFRKLIILETTPKTKNSRVSISGHVTSRVNHSLKLKSRTVHWSIYGLLRYRNLFFMNGSPQLNKVPWFRLTSFNTCARQIHRFSIRFRSGEMQASPFESLLPSIFVQWWCEHGEVQLCHPWGWIQACAAYAGVWKWG